MGIAEAFGGFVIAVAMIVLAIRVIRDLVAELFEE